MMMMVRSVAKVTKMILTNKMILEKMAIKNPFIKKANRITEKNSLNLGQKMTKLGEIHRRAISKHRYLEIINPYMITDASLLKLSYHKIRCSSFNRSNNPMKMTNGRSSRVLAS